MKLRSAVALLSLTLTVAACGDLPFNMTSSEPEAPGHSGPPTISPIEQPIQTSDEARPVSTAEATTMNTAMFRASGNEPSWAVTAADKTAVYERPGAKSVGITVRRLTYARGVEFIGVLNGRPFSLNLQAETCTDSMSGQKFPFTARVTASGQRMTGCAGPTDVMPKAQTRASTAAPAAARTTPPKPAAPKPAEEKPAATEAPKAETPKTEDTTTVPAPTPAAETSPAVTPTAETATPAVTPQAPSATSSAADAAPASDPASQPVTPEPSATSPAAATPPLPEADATPDE